MALNYETLIHAVSKAPEQRTVAEINDFILPWLKQSLRKKQGKFQKISDDRIYDMCKTVVLERRQPWDVVIQENEPGDTFYIILQGSVNIYRLDEDSPKMIERPFDTVVEFAQLDADPEKREQLISQIFGNYVVTLTGGSDFGERALITNEPRSATVMTVTPTDLLVVDREVFNRTIKTAHEKELQEKTDFINRCPLFCSWSARLKRLVSLSLERGRFAYDSILYRQGAPADAVYFIWSGEVKLYIDPLLHWLQYPHLFPQTDPMRQHALELFLPMLQLPRPIITKLTESSAIKRRYMTYAEAEQERANRTLNVALLNPGDMIGLESYVCEFNTHLNSARCTTSCDLFYILKHNFLRLQKRVGTQGLTERLKEMVHFSLEAYPKRILHLPLFRALMKRQLAPNSTDEHQQYHQKQSWLLHIHNPTHTKTRRTGMTIKRNASASTYPSAFRNTNTMQYYKDDHVRTNQIEYRLKQWHAQLGDNSKAQIRSLTRVGTGRTVESNLTQTTTTTTVAATMLETLEMNSRLARTSASMPKTAQELPVPVDLLIEAATGFNEPEPTDTYDVTGLVKSQIPQIHIYTKQEQYEDLRAYLKQAWKQFLRRPIPVIY